MTMRELATKSGVSPNTIVKLELHGQEARMSTARKLAAALGCEPAELLGETPAPAGQAPLEGNS
jgi:transcriptional regulator with XRE-family HTH domain